MSANYDITRAVGPSDIMKIRKAHKRYFGSQLVELLLFFFCFVFTAAHHSPCCQLSHVALNTPTPTAR